MYFWLKEIQKKGWNFLQIQINISYTVPQHCKNDMIFNFFPEPEIDICCTSILLVQNYLLIRSLV